MKTINLDFLGADDTVFHLLLAYMYDEAQDRKGEFSSQDWHNLMNKFAELNQMDTTLRHIRFGGYDYRDGLENLVSLRQTIHIYETFQEFIDKYFPEFKTVKIIGETNNVDWGTDLEKINITG